MSSIRHISMDTMCPGEKQVLAEYVVGQTAYLEALCSTSKENLVDAFAFGRRDSLPKLDQAAISEIAHEAIEDQIPSSVIAHGCLECDPRVSTCNFKAKKLPCSRGQFLNIRVHLQFYTETVCALFPCVLGMLFSGFNPRETPRLQEHFKTSLEEDLDKEIESLIGGINGIQQQYGLKEPYHGLLIQSLCLQEDRVSEFALLYSLGNRLNNQLGIRGTSKEGYSYYALNVERVGATGSLPPFIFFIKKDDEYEVMFTTESDIATKKLSSAETSELVLAETGNIQIDQYQFRIKEDSDKKGLYQVLCELDQRKTI